VAGPYPITAANSAGGAIDLTGVAQLVLQPGPAARATITSATPPAVVADGVSLSTLVIRVTDQYGNTVPQDLALTVSGGLNTIISGSGNTDSQGQITRTLQAGLLVGTAALTLDTGSSPFTTTNGLPLITGPAVSATLTASSPTLVAGGSPITMTFYLEDAWQHPVGGWVITPTLTPRYGVFTGSNISNAAGQVIQTLTPLTTSGQTTVTVSGLALSGDTALTVTPNVAKIARVEANPKQLMVTESTALTFTITDAYGNRILPAAIAATSLLTGTFNGGSASTITQTTNAAAQFTATLTTRNSGTDTLAFVGPAGALTLHPNSDILAFTPDELIVVALDQTQPVTAVAGVPLQIMASSMDRYGNVIDPWAPMNYVWIQTSKTAEPGFGAFASLDPNSRMVRFTPRIVGVNKLNAVNGVFESNTLTVTVIAGPPQQAAVLTPPASVEANDVSTTTITLANLRDQYGNAVADGHVITVTVDTKSARGVVSGGLANVVITATRKAGNHPIVATSSTGPMSLAGYSTVKFYAGPPEKAQVLVIPATVIPIDTVTATMVMTIYDRYDNLVENGQVITVTVDKATVGGTTTTLNGRLARTLTPTALGNATVSGAGPKGALFLVGDTELLFIPGAPTYANITANPAKVIGDGQSGSSLTVVLKDAVGFPSGSSGTAVITSSRGTIVPTTTTVVNGSFGATFYAERGVGPVNLFVTFEGKPMLPTGDSLEMVPDVPYTATLKTSPPTVRVDTTDKSTLVLTLVDQWSNPITSSTPVSVTPSMGSLAPAQMNSVGHVVTMTFTPDTVAGPVTFTIRAPQGSSPLRVSGDTLTVLPGPIYSVTITAPPAPVEVVAGQSVRFTAIGVDKFGNPTSTGPFEWRKLFGGIGGGSGIGNGILQDGVFTGTVSGILGVQAYTGTIYSEGKSVTVRPGPIASAIVSASPITIPVGGFASQLVITLRDAYGNLVADGLSPAVTTNLGTLSGSGLTSNGLTTRTLYSGSFSGRPDIFVNGLKAGGDSVFFQPRAWADATPSTLVANNTDTAQVRVRLLDQNGLPIGQLPQTITATIGVLDYNACTQDADYVMVCSLRATNQVGTGYIYVDGFPAQGVITFTTGAATLALIETASPVVAVSGLSTASLKITVQDQFGHTKSDYNSPLNVTSSIGTIGGVQPTLNGVTYRTFTGGSVPGIATLSVTGLTVTGTQFIQVSGVTATIQAAKSYLTADGQNTTVLTITLQDGAGKTASFINHSLIVNSSLGSIGGIRPTVKGVTTRTLTAGQTEGNAALTVLFDDTAAAGLGAQALINLPVSGQTSLPFYHPVARVTASPEVLIANGSSQTQLTVALEDVFGNPLTHSTAPLTVTTSAGTVSGFQATVGGATRRTLTAATSSAMAAIGVSGLNGLTVVGSPKVQFVGTAIIDGNFASGTLDNWIIGSGPVTATKVYTTLLKLSDYVDGIPVSPPGSGYMARLGASTQDKTGHDLSETWLRQSVYVTPSGISQLQFKYRILSYDVAVGSASKGSLEYDPFKVFINDTQVLRDGYIYDEAWKDWYYTNPSSPKDMPNEFEAGNQWRKGILDLSKYAGKIATIEFKVSNAIMPADNTWVYVYDIKVVHADIPSYKVYLPVIIR
jgi:adhesin/invasin